MPYTVSWFIPQQVIGIYLDGYQNTDDLVQINQETMQLLNDCSEKVSVLIDARMLQAGYKTADDLRDSQKYMDHSNVEHAVVVAENKLSRLITLLAFNLSRAHFIQFDSQQKAMFYLKQRGYNIAC